MRLTIQVFQNGEAVGEYVANFPKETETEAVDLFLQHARIDLRYRFLGEYGFVQPSEKYYLVLA